MKLTLIRPRVLTTYAAERMEPLEMACLAGLTPADVEVNFFDDRIESIPFDNPTDVVAISVQTYAARRAYQIASHFRERGVPVIMGGYHPSLIPQEVSLHADAVVIGEAEVIWPQVIEDAKKKRLRRFYTAPFGTLLSSMKINREIFKGKKYLPVTLIQLGRGCKNSCHYCTTGTLYLGRYNSRSVHEVVMEIESQKNSYLFFTDENIALHREVSMELFRALKPLKVKWGGQIGVETLNDEELLKVMAESGCCLLLIGFESLSQSNLQQMRKNYKIRTDHYRQTIQRVYDHGIMIIAAFLFGYDHDKPDSFKITLDFALENKFFLAHFNCLTPYPGTPLYYKLKQNNSLILDEWWLNKDYRFGQATFQPKNLSAEELAIGCDEITECYYTYKNIFKRGLIRKTHLRQPVHLILYLVSNMIIKRGLTKMRPSF